MIRLIALFVIFVLSLTPTTIFAQKYQVTLLKLVCNQTSESGQDEIYIELSAPVSRRIPNEYRSMNEDSDIDTWELNQTYTINKNGILSLVVKEEDSTSGDDLIGIMLIPITGPKSETSIKMAGDGSEYYLYYKIEALANASDFTMVFMSDPQYEYCESSHCENVLGDSYVANTRHVSSIKKVKNAVSNFKGVVINGDLTNTGDDHQRDQFVEDYQNNFTIYPGLGNHDYQGYIGKWCAEPGVATAKYYCTKEMMDYLEECVTSISYTRFDHTYTHGDDGRKHVGSYAYSWDIGNYHFVQLNNYPSYAVDFSVYLSNWVAHERYDINQSFDWLIDDLSKVPAGKKIIINLHVMSGDNTPVDKFNQNDHPSEFNRFKRVLQPYVSNNSNEPEVVAIFAGHIHKWVLDRNVETNTTLDHKIAISIPGRRTDAKVPVYFCGGAEWSRFLRVDFKSDRMEMRIVNSTNGNLDYEGNTKTIRF